MLQQIQVPTLLHKMYTKSVSAGFNGIQAADLNKRVQIIATDRLEKVNAAFAAQAQAEYNKGYALSQALKTKATSVTEELAQLEARRQGAGRRVEMSLKELFAHPVQHSLLLAGTYSDLKVNHLNISQINKRLKEQIAAAYDGKVQVLDVEDRSKPLCLDEEVTQCILVALSALRAQMRADVDTCGGQVQEIFRAVNLCILEFYQDADQNIPDICDKFSNVKLSSINQPEPLSAMSPPSWASPQRPRRSSRRGSA